MSKLKEAAGVRMLCSNCENNLVAVRSHTGLCSNCTQERQQPSLPDFGFSESLAEKIYG